MQATAEFHHQVADAAFPKADPVFGDAASFDAAVDVLDPEPTIMQSLIFSLLLRCQLPAAATALIGFPYSKVRKATFSCQKRRRNQPFGDFNPPILAHVF